MSQLLRASPMRGTTLEGQKDDEQADLLFATFLALTDLAKENIGHIQSAFVHDICATVKFQRERFRTLEEHFEEAAKRWEAEKEAIEREREKSALSMALLLEEHEKVLASQEAAYVVQSHQKQQDEVLHQLLAEKEQLQCQYNELLTTNLTISKNLQKLEKENEELKEQVNKHDEEIKKLLLTIPECSKFDPSISHLLVEANTKCPLQTLSGNGTNSDGHAEPGYLQDSKQQVLHTQTATLGNSGLQNTAEQELLYYKRKCKNIGRAYDRLLGQLAERSLSRRNRTPLQEVVLNKAHLMSVKESRPAGKTELCNAISGPREVIAGKKCRERPWRNTRARATASERDPHDDFLDTPREIAVNEKDATVQTNDVRCQGVQVSSDNRPRPSTVQGKQLSSAGSPKPASAVKPASFLQEDNVCGQNTTHDGAASIAGAPQGATSELKFIDETHGIGNNPPEMGCGAAYGQAVKEASHLATRPLATVANDSKRRGKQSFSLAGAPFKYVEPVRKKRDREALAGTECKQCKEFYDAVLAGDPDGMIGNRCEHRNAVSRHRYRYAPPQTPDGFWNIGFDSDL